MNLFDHDKGESASVSFSNLFPSVLPNIQKPAAVPASRVTVTNKPDVSVNLHLTAHNKQGMTHATVAGAVTVTTQNGAKLATGNSDISKVQETSKDDKLDFGMDTAAISNIKKALTSPTKPAVSTAQAENIAKLRRQMRAGLDKDATAKAAALAAEPKATRYGMNNPDLVSDDWDFIPTRAKKEKAYDASQARIEKERAAGPRVPIAEKIATAVNEHPFRVGFETGLFFGSTPLAKEAKVLGKKAVDGACELAEKVATGTRNWFNKSAKVAEQMTATTIKPHDLMRTHSLSGKRSTKKVMNIAETMRKEGWTFEPIDVAEHNGSYYILDGHHRVAAAKMAGVDVPFKVVQDIRVHETTLNTIEEVLESAETCELDRIIPRGPKK